MKGQWFAYQLESEGFFSGPDAFDGIAYASRKYRGHNAIALHSGYVDRVKTHPRFSFNTSPFKKRPEYKTLKSSPFRIAAP